MTARMLLVGAALSALCISCSDDAPPDGPNPPRLWLALDGSEIEVKLSPVEPPLF